jgi:CRP/FNR family transcriptional regulator
MRSIHLFANLSASSLELLRAAAQRLTVQAGEIILLEGDIDAPVFFIIQGECRVYRTNPDGREQVLSNLKSGDVFNMPTAFTDSRESPATVEAISAVELFVIQPNDFVQLASETPDIALAVMRSLSNKLHHFTDLTHDLSLRSARGRLAHFLLTQMEAENHWTQEEIAAQIGTVREVVSRTLRAFVKEGLIIMQRQHITILNPEALKQLIES